MKTALLLLMGAALPASCLAQQQPATQQKPVTTQTEHVHRGASHTHTRTVVPTERRTTTRWRYHSGPKRAKAQETQEPVPNTSTVPTNTGEADKKPVDKK